MKLKYYSEQTFPKMGGGIRNATPKVNFGKGGVIAINKAGVALMELSFQDKVTIAQDEEDAANWYLFKDPQHGYALRNKDFEKTGSLAFNHKGLQVEICTASEMNAEESHNFIIAGQPTVMKGDKTKYWGLLKKSKV